MYVHSSWFAPQFEHLLLACVGPSQRICSHISSAALLLLLLLSLSLLLATRRRAPSPARRRARPQLRCCRAIVAEVGRPATRSVHTATPALKGEIGSPKAAVEGWPPSPPARGPGSGCEPREGRRVDAYGQDKRIQVICLPFCVCRHRRRAGSCVSCSGARPCRRHQARRRRGSRCRGSRRRFRS